MTPPQNYARSSAVGLHRRCYWLIERLDPGCDAEAWGTRDKRVIKRDGGVQHQTRHTDAVSRSPR